jgi:hypothetical protein
MLGGLYCLVGCTAWWAVLLAGLYCLLGCTAWGAEQFKLQLAGQDPLLLLAAELYIDTGFRVHADMYNALGVQHHTVAGWMVPMRGVQSNPTYHLLINIQENDDGTIVLHLPALCVHYSSTRCMHTYRAKSWHHAHMRHPTDTLVAHQELCCPLQQVSCTSHRGPVAVSIHRQRRPHTPHSPPPTPGTCTLKAGRSVRPRALTGMALRSWRSTPWAPSRSGCCWSRPFRQGMHVRRKDASLARHGLS